MATRSLIGRTKSDGTIESIYCHWDGYPENNGKLLREYWSKDTLIDQLMSLGNLRALSFEIGKKQNFDQPTDRNWCLAYGRDRGERNNESKLHKDLDSFVDELKGCGAEYLYLWQNDTWLCWKYDGTAIDLYNMKEENQDA